MLIHRLASDADCAQLAAWNHQLIRDEGHRNPSNVAELTDRMGAWLAGEYQAVIFSLDDEPVAYALYREQDDSIALRQFFVLRDRRRLGVGRQAMTLLRRKIWPPGKRLIVEVLTANPAAVAFWRSMGFSEYSVTLEILPS